MLSSYHKCYNQTMNLKIIYYFLLITFFLFPRNTFAQEFLETRDSIDIDLHTTPNEDDEATKAADTKTATSSSIVKRVVEKEADITEPTAEVKGKLEKILEENPVGNLTPSNFIRFSLRYAVEQGVPANTLVLILMFPLIATVVVFSRHVIGLKSFGIFTPALLSVAFLNTGLSIGIFLYVFILLVATIVRMLLKKVKFQYLPRMAVFMWAVTMSIFGVLLISPAIGREELITIGIFPILILILLNEDFLDSQITRSFPQALRLSMETLIVATSCYYLMKWEYLQKIVLTNAEIFTAAVLVAIYILERYDGLRFLEIWRFRKIVKSED
jgi:uncharacterized protein with transglutaminase domain